MALVICLIAGFSIALIPHILWVMGKIWCKIRRGKVSYKYFGISAIVLTLICWCCMAYGFFIGRWNVETIKIDYAHHEIPKAFDGFKIVQISDFHLSSFDDAPERVMNFINEINKNTPDLVCFTGDLVSIGKREAEKYTEYLKDIEAKYGILSVLGNHDFMIYGLHTEEEREREVQDFVDFQRNILGWKVLRNESIEIHAEDSSKITILGVDNSNFRHQGFKNIHCGDLMKALKGTEGFRILLSHDPSHWNGEVIPMTDIPLTLSGHTHNGQVNLLGIQPARVAFSQTAGRYDHEGQTLYVNIGLGCTVPFRIGTNPEVTLITLRSI